MGSSPASRQPTDADELVVSTRGLRKAYGSTVAVDQLDLRVRRGEVYGFVGPNGAGKTTTLRMLLGLVRPTDGTATVLGRPAGDRAGMSDVGAMIEGPGFYPFLSGRRNLVVMARHAGVDPSRSADVLEVVGLTRRAGDRFSAYSSGMKQRLGLAAALLKDPELLILDEPTSGLDPEGMSEMRGLLRELGRGRRTVLLSSHLMTEVEQICDRVGVIAEGRLVAEGTLGELRGANELRVRATPSDQAERVLAALRGVGPVRHDDGALVVGVDPIRSGEINRHLVQAGVEVSELTPSRTSLEHVFLELVGRERGARERG